MGRVIVPLYSSEGDFAPAVGGPAVTWNPADKAAGITLSNGDLTAHMASDTDYVPCGVRATVALSGKKYFRFVLDDLSAPADPNLGVGVASSGASLSATYPTTFSGVANSAGATVISALASLLINNVYFIDAIIAVIVGDIADCAVDIPNLKIWFRKNGTGNWNNSGTDDPATNTGGATLSSATYYPFMAGQNGVGVTARFADDGSGTAPSGFSWVG